MKTTDFSAIELADLIISRILSGEIIPVDRETEDTGESYEDRLYSKALDLIHSTVTEIEKEGIFEDAAEEDDGGAAWYDEAIEEALPRVMRILQGRVAFVVLQDAAVDFETEVTVVGVYDTREKARRKLSALMEEEKKNWEEDEITLCSPDRFEAYRDESWARDHAAYSIHAREIE